MNISKTVIQEIFNTIGKNAYESGGILGTNNFFEINHYIFDKYGTGNKYKYTPCVDFLNNIISGEWLLNDIMFCGIIHSHINKPPILSKGDLRYAEKILNNFEYLNCIYMLVLSTQKPIKIHCYKVAKHKFIESQLLKTYDEYNI